MEWRIQATKGKGNGSAKKWNSGNFLMNLFIYKKQSNMQKNTKNNIRESITYENDLVKFSRRYT